MIIGIEAQRLFRSKKHGMEIVALELIRQLQQLDQENQYFIYAKKDDDTNCIDVTQNFTIYNINNAPYPIWEQFYLPKTVKKTNLALLHCTANTAPLFFKKPLVITIHDLIYLETISFSGSAYQNFGNIYRRYIVPKVAKKAALIITVSEYEKHVIADRLKIPENKIRVVYNGVNSHFKPILDRNKLNKFAEKYSLPEKFLLHFGNTAPKKNTIGVLNSYKIYVASVSTPIKLVITDCSIDYINSLLIYLKSPELIKNILLLDYIPFNYIPFLYNLATIFLYPSHRESFGMPVIEAMACGVPVITSNTSAMPEIAGGAACLINPKNPVEIFEKITLLLNDGNFYKEKQEKGIKNASRFNWKNAALKTLSIYKELV